MIRNLSIIACLLLGTTAVANPPIELLGVAQIPGSAIDHSGLKQDLGDGCPADRLGGFSGIEYTGHGDRFIILPDRGAGDGRVPYPCRMHQVDLRINRSKSSIDVDWIDTVMLTGDAGQTLDGSFQTRLSDTEGDRHWLAMDPESIRRWGDQWLISDEYGPHLAIFDSAGKFVDQWLLPADRLCHHRAEHGIGKNDPAGCVNNRGLEGLAVTPEGVWSAYQSTLMQDGDFDGKWYRGLLTRWMLCDNHGKRIKEIAYPMENDRVGISEILTYDHHRFLVIERDGKQGNKTRCKRIYLTDISPAEDVSDCITLRDRKDLVTAQKTLWMDLTDPRWGLGEIGTAEKPEGMTWGPNLPDGRSTLWICWDNDFEANQTSNLACFAVDRKTQRVSLRYKQD